jgi:hypothetical protein
MLRTLLVLVLALVTAATAASGCSSVERPPYRKRCYGPDKAYYAGDTFNVDCNTCTCNGDGSISCTEAACAVCEQDGNGYQAGESFPAGDGCNLCTCQPDSSIVCTTVACIAPCFYDGMEHQPGDTFPALDGCNTCTCEDEGVVSCTELACACDPATEWWRHYESLDPRACALLDFTCPDNTMRFDNACGCGCEQDRACAETYDCTPPSTCDIPQLQADCPYSEIIQ